MSNIDTKVKIPSLAIVIIAAGNSSRLGENKQLITFNGKTLLQHSIALASFLTDKTLCVLGYEAEKIKNNLADIHFRSVTNQNWKSGMGSSIATGVEYWTSNQLVSAPDAIMILLCDQYLLTIEDLEMLYKSWKEYPNKITASQYSQEGNSNDVILGAPAIFPSSHFPELLKLKSQGARKILEQNRMALSAVNIKNAGWDLDTPNDLLQLINLEKSQLKSHLNQ
ncbi:MAG: nucleotidyltransferase family protein [Kangiellaceae bacterium]|nr:nucleotidyltransferase family protein [Kangiellaceae bacterium]